MMVVVVTTVASLFEVSNAMMGAPTSAELEVTLEVDAASARSRIWSNSGLAPSPPATTEAEADLMFRPWNSERLSPLLLALFVPLLSPLLPFLKDLMI